MNECYTEPEPVVERQMVVETEKKVTVKNVVQHAQLLVQLWAARRTRLPQHKVCISLHSFSWWLASCQWKPWAIPLVPMQWHWCHGLAVCAMR